MTNKTTTWTVTWTDGRTDRVDAWDENGAEIAATDALREDIRANYPKGKKGDADALAAFRAHEGEIEGVVDEG